MIFYIKQKRQNALLLDILPLILFMKTYYITQVARLVSNPNILIPLSIETI